ncbi:MAG: acetate/propionate family kinase [Burkholderiales bacterium]|nr:acetate/propionate family kinase [Burkholderiales bacterium]
MNILIINAGSSSLKFKLFQANKTQIFGSISNLNMKNGSFQLFDLHGNLIHQQHILFNNNNYLEAIDIILNNDNLIDIKLNAIIHRVVHGGDIFRDITQLNDDVFNKLSRFSSYAPLHQPYNLLIAKTTMDYQPTISNYACFDTSFHQTIPELNRVYAIPWKYTELGIKKYGFHGLSYQYISSVLEQRQEPGKWIIAHLGSGCSLCAMNNYESVSSSMGFSTLDGLPMMTRSGELDVQIPLYLQDKYNLTTKEVLHILNNESGLFGICGGSNMEEIIKSNAPRAALAVELFSKQVAAFIAKLSIDLSGLDGIVFTAGIGANSPKIRYSICNYLQWLGVAIDVNANNTNNLTINTPNSKIKVLVINTDEEQAMLSQYLAI